ncbi:uncharacterized protein VICG_00185 [Vittaforma corneae ATCC 50505]|uniref:N-acetyltransferase ESCO zinc-finger domain-containing protein n=1 Tax=Vittaforma corneae (strain ATCC 50505) TaxID=993615 RepID=L2GQS8_VITCO|nr:uncharacterized protein VICG_00185 [Vittaforma corneae ATCC 50505]ELA42870.1 hypothetical protein VICG_00185 [Vittaforma corneae ATCC 50505]
MLDVSLLFMPSMCIYAYAHDANTVRCTPEMQRILGFGKNVFKYCLKCKIKYNSTNMKDVQFHKRLHRTYLIPKCEKICENFYQKGNTFYFGHEEVEAKCIVKKHKSQLRLSEIWATSTLSKDRLLANLKMAFPDIDNII